MSDAYLLADTNSVVYDDYAGGTDLLDAHLKLAEKQGREFASTETVRKRIKDGPLRAELGHSLADKGIPVVSAPDTEQRVHAGTLSRISAGEVSSIHAGNRH